MANPTATRELTKCKAYCIVSLFVAAFWGTLAMLIHPLLAVPTAMTVFVVIFVLLCVNNGGKA